MNFKWLDFFTQKLPFSGNLSFTLVVTLFIILAAVFLKKPLHFVIRKILKKISQKNTFFQSHLLGPAERPITLISTAVIWFFDLEFSAPLMEIYGRYSSFLIKIYYSWY